MGRRRPRHRAAAPRHRRGPTEAGWARRRGDHARHRHDRPAGPRNRQLRPGRRCAGAAVAARRRAGPAAGPGRPIRWGAARDRRVDAAGPAAEHGSVLPGQPENHLRRGRLRPRRQRQAASRRPQPAVDVRSARLRSRRPDRLRVLRRHHRGHVLGGHRPPAAADVAGSHRGAGGAAGARRCARHGRPGGRPQRDRQDRVGRGHGRPGPRGRCGGGRRTRPGGKRGRRGGAGRGARRPARCRSSTTRRPTTC